MSNPKVGLPPRELVPKLYAKFKDDHFTRAKVRKKLGDLAAISVTRALNDGWLIIVKKVDLVNVYQLSARALASQGVGDSYVRRGTYY